MLISLLFLSFFKESRSTAQLKEATESIPNDWVTFLTTLKIGTPYEFEFQGKFYLLFICLPGKETITFIIIDFFAADFNNLKGGWELFLKRQQEDRHQFMSFFVDISEPRDYDLMFTNTRSEGNFLFKIIKAQKKQNLISSLARKLTNKITTNFSENILVHSLSELKELRNLKNKIELVLEKTPRADFLLSDDSYYGIFLYAWSFKLRYKAPEGYIEFPFKFIYYLTLINTKVARIRENLSLQKISMMGHMDFVPKRSKNILYYTVDEIRMSFDLDSLWNSVPFYQLEGKSSEQKEVPVEKLVQTFNSHFIVVSGEEKKWEFEIPVFFVDKETTSTQLYLILRIHRYDKGVLVDAQLYGLVFDLSNEYTSETVDFNGTTITFTLARVLHERELRFNLHHFQENTETDFAFEIRMEEDLAYTKATKDETYLHVLEAFNGALITVKREDELNELLNKKSAKKSKFTKKMFLVFFLVVLFLIGLLLSVFLLLKVWNKDTTNY